MLFCSDQISFHSFSFLDQEGTVHVIYGLLDQPLASLEQLNLSRIHTGIQRVLMLRPDTPSPTLPPDVETLDVVAPNVIIPNEETTYWCFIQKLPENMPKNHIVMVWMPLKIETLTIEFICTEWSGCFRQRSPTGSYYCFLFASWAKHNMGCIVMVRKEKHKWGKMDTRITSHSYFFHWETSMWWNANLIESTQ